jgi:AcrR family transcriptional regulator
MSPRLGLDMNTILSTAAKIADEHGIEEVTLTTLAKYLKVRTPSLYNHIDGLQDLKIKLTIFGLQKLREELAIVAIGKSGDEAIHALANAYISFARNHPGLYAATLNVQDHNNSEVQKEENTIVDIVLRILIFYNLEGDGLIHATRGLRSLLHGFASLEQNKGFGLSQKVDESIHLTIDALIAGFYIIKENYKKGNIQK